MFNEVDEGSWSLVQKDKYLGDFFISRVLIDRVIQYLYLWNQNFDW